jgi:hypothetical protein
VLNIAESTEDLRQLGITHAGGSTIEPIAVGGGPLRLLLTAPIGVATTLFRPMVFEIRNPLMIASALEVLVFTTAAVRIGVRGFRRALMAIRRSWLNVFCVVFVVLFAFAVGVSTVNLGTLSRYRVPMLPFYAMALAALGDAAQRKRAAPSRAPRAGVPVGRPVFRAARDGPTGLHPRPPTRPDTRRSGYRHAAEPTDA